MAGHEQLEPAVRPVKPPDGSDFVPYAVYSCHKTNPTSIDAKIHVSGLLRQDNHKMKNRLTKFVKMVYFLPSSMIALNQVIRSDVRGHRIEKNIRI